MRKGTQDVFNAVVGAFIVLAVTALLFTCAWMAYDTGIHNSDKVRLEQRLAACQRLLPIEDQTLCIQGAKP